MISKNYLNNLYQVSEKIVNNLEFFFDIIIERRLITLLKNNYFTIFNLSKIINLSKKKRKYLNIKKHKKSFDILFYFKHKSRLIQLKSIKQNKMYLRNYKFCLNDFQLLDIYKRNYKEKLTTHNLNYKRYKNISFVEFYCPLDVFFFKKLHLSSLILFENKLFDNLNIELIKFFKFNILFYKFFKNFKLISSKIKYLKRKNLINFEKSKNSTSRLLKNYKKFLKRRFLRFFENKYKKLTKTLVYIDNIKNKLLYKGNFLKNSDYFLLQYQNTLKKKEKYKIILKSIGRFLTYRFDRKLQCILPIKYSKYLYIKSPYLKGQFLNKFTKVFRKKKILRLTRQSEFDQIKKSANFYIKNPVNKLIISGRKKYGLNVYNRIFLVFTKLFKAHTIEHYEVVNRILKKLFIRATVRSSGNHSKSRKVTLRQNCYFLTGFSELKTRVNLFFLDTFNSLCRKKDKSSRSKKMHDIIALEFLNLSYKKLKKIKTTQFFKMYIELNKFMFKEFRFRGLFDFYRNRILEGIQPKKRRIYTKNKHRNYEKILELKKFKKKKKIINLLKKNLKHKGLKLIIKPVNLKKNLFLKLLSKYFKSRFIPKKELKKLIRAVRNLCERYRKISKILKNILKIYTKFKNKFFFRKYFKKNKKFKKLKKLRKFQKYKYYYRTRYKKFSNKNIKKNKISKTTREFFNYIYYNFSRTKKCNKFKKDSFFNKKPIYKLDRNSSYKKNIQFARIYDIAGRILTRIKQKHILSGPRSTQFKYKRHLKYFSKKKLTTFQRILKIVKYLKHKFNKSYTRNLIKLDKAKIIKLFLIFNLINYQNLIKKIKQ